MRPLLLTRSALRGATRASSSRLLPLCQAPRLYSIKAEAASTSKLRPLDPTKLSVTTTTHPKPLSKPEDLVFGREFTGKPWPASACPCDAPLLTC